ncbi:MAG: NAD(+)/NADH kinase [Treponema sp.]|nr:NAD(+)/NADH kinase [Spirochaetales bacterium]MDY4902601.1 NAD(+)/NADH kinase [Treponema sp.]
MIKCLILANSFKEHSQILAQEIKSFLCERKVRAEIFTYNGKDAECRNCESREAVLSSGMEVPFKDFDFAVTLGGDGTVLFAGRGCAPLGIPVFPVNLGEFGFLAAVQKENWQEELVSYLEGKSFISQRSLAEGEVIRNGRTAFKCTALNDIIVSSHSSCGLVNLNVAYNHALLGAFKSTGVIVATSTGSTAYSAAAGGPIVDSSLDALVLTPISSFSLSARPLVLSSQSEIAMTVLPSRVDVSLSADGQLNFPLEQGDVVIIGISKHKARLIGSTQEKFYSALQSKLNWSGGPRA